MRDTYDCGETVIIVTSDRQSAFDRLLASVPFKVGHLACPRQCSSTYIDAAFGKCGSSLVRLAETKGKECCALTMKNALAQGQVLNQTSAWWMQHTEHITPNALLSIPDPNVAIMKKCKVLPIEFVVRGFMTGVYILPEQTCACSKAACHLIPPAFTAAVPVALPQHPHPNPPPPGPLLPQQLCLCTALIPKPLVLLRSLLESSHHHKTLPSFCCR